MASRLPESDRSLLHTSGQLYDEQAMADVRRMVEADETVDHIGAQVHQLPPDADEARPPAPVLAR